MNTLVNRSFKFASNRFEEWMGGNCISDGSLNALITVTVNRDEVNVCLEDVDEICDDFSRSNHRVLWKCNIF